MAKITVDTEKCKGCFLCIEVCPKGFLKAGDKLNKRGVNPVEFTGKEACSGCCFCAMICPDCCIEVYK
jgi:2-oxoglutarate ferredoxin oxidoreductase subunit delta